DVVDMTRGELAPPGEERLEEILGRPERRRLRGIGASLRELRHDVVRNHDQRDAVVLEAPAQDDVVSESPQPVQALVEMNEVAAFLQAHLRGDRRQRVQIAAYAREPENPRIVRYGHGAASGPRIGAVRASASRPIDVPTQKPPSTNEAGRSRPKVTEGSLSRRSVPHCFGKSRIAPRSPAPHRGTRPAERTQASNREAPDRGARPARSSSSGLPLPAQCTNGDNRRPA